MTDDPKLVILRSVIDELVILRSVIRKHYPTIAGHVLRLQEGGETRGASEWESVARDFANVIGRSEPIVRGKEKQTLCVDCARMVRSVLDRFPRRADA